MTIFLDEEIICFIWIISSVIDTVSKLSKLFGALKWQYGISVKVRISQHPFPQDYIWSVLFMFIYIYIPQDYLWSIYI